VHKHKYYKRESNEHGGGKTTNSNSAYTKERDLNKLLLFRKEFVKLQ